MSDYKISTLNVLEIPQNSKTTEEYNPKDEKILLKNASYWNVFHVFTILGTSALFLSPQLLLPRQNSIYYPSYWHEINILGGIVSFIASIKLLLECAIYMKEKSLLTLSVFLKLYLCRVLPMLGLFYLSHYVWTIVMELQHPMPLLGIFVFFGTWLVFLCTLSFGIMFPSQLRLNDEFKHKIRIYLVHDIWWFVMSLQKDVLSFAFKNINGNLQLLFALLIPAAKETNKRILSKQVSKITGDDNEKANDVLNICVNIHYSLFVAIRLNGAETQTVICFIIVEFLMHFWMTHKIIRHTKRVTADFEQSKNIDKRKKRAIMRLILAELVEGIVPLSYAIGFAMAYFGPNAYLIGNVLSDYWAYEKVENIERLFYIQFSLIGVDCIGVVLNTSILSKFGNLNLVQEACNTVKAYWTILAIMLANSITIYFAFNDINTAIDMTMEFEWISTEGRLRFIFNATDLCDREKMHLLNNATIIKEII